MRPPHCTCTACEEIEEARIRLDERKKVLAEVFAILDRRAHAYDSEHAYEHAGMAIDLAVREILTLLPEEK